MTSGGPGHAGFQSAKLRHVYMPCKKNPVFFENFYRVEIISEGIWIIPEGIWIISEKNLKISRRRFAIPRAAAASARFDVAASLESRCKGTAIWGGRQGLSPGVVCVCRQGCCSYSHIFEPGGNPILNLTILTMTILTMVGCDVVKLSNCHLVIFEIGGLELGSI